MLTAMMPAVFAIAAPPGSNVPLIVGSLTLGVAIIAAFAAYTARRIACASRTSATEMLRRFPRLNTSAFASRRSLRGADAASTASLST